MSFVQFLVCVGFGAVVYGIGFYRGLRQGYGLAAKRDE